MSSSRRLDEILAHKREELVQRKQKVSEAGFREMAQESPSPGGLIAAIQARIEQGLPAVIAELKRASPSRGMLREDFDPSRIASSYQRGGAVALSVLTDAKYFKGSGVVLEMARRGSSLPILRKDFIIDPYQVYESCAMGASALLLIVAALPDETLKELQQLAGSVGLDVLMEVHDEAELKRAQALNAPLIGINNRNLQTFEVDLATTERLATQLSDQCVVCESGIRSADDIARIRRAGVQAFLIGESLMRADDPGAALAELLTAS